MRFKAHKIGLALGSGGPRGLAHIGVLRALEEHHIPVNAIAGSSVGSLIGGLYALTGSAQQVEKIAGTITLQDLARVFLDIGSVSGVVKGSKIETFLDQYFRSKKIEELRTPFAAVATDLFTGSPVIIRSGSVAKAIHASSAVPVFLESVEFENKLLMDGGVSQPVPVEAARKMGATFVIAVNLDAYAYGQAQSGGAKPRISIAGISALNILRHNLSMEQSRTADVSINPEVSSVSTIDMTQFVNGAEVIKKGYEATLKLIPLIKRAV